jgi:hypothetical protein
MQIHHEYSELTDSEKYLTRLCKHSFLNLWSWPHVYRNQLCFGNQGKEICDLLVVFESNIIIFSDKYCKFPDTGNLELDWCRWFKKAIFKSAQQIWGAERWIRKFPDRLYLDKKCSRPFPLSLPNSNDTIFHRIVVAHGSSERSRKVLGGNGSLMVNTNIIGKDHFNSKSGCVIPFTVGNLSKDKGFVHVLDDFTLDIILKTVDTVADFINYLTKKQQLFESGNSLMASGEEDLLALYLQKLNEAGEHDFQLSKDQDLIVLAEGFWDDFQKHPDRISQIEANAVSYTWDKLIDAFSKHVLNGSLHFSSHEKISDHEISLRFLAKESRTHRRFLSRSLYTIMERADSEGRSARVLQNPSTDEPYYVFLALDRRKDKTLEEYRIVRRNLLENYCFVTKLKFPDAKHIVGIATEPMSYGHNRSEDLIYLDTSHWTKDDQKEAKRIQKDLGLLSKTRRTEFTEKEYPRMEIKKGLKGRDRNKPCFCGSGKKYKKCCGKN